MKTSKLLVFSLALAVSAVAADKVTDRGAAERAVIFADDFSGRTELGSNYKTSLCGPDGWVVRDGVLTGKQTNPEHGAIIRKEINFADLDVELDFRFNGGARFNFVIDDKNEKSVHAGHICRVSISPKSLKISDDKTGAMNLEVQALRKTAGLSAAKKQSLDDILKRTQAAATLTLQRGEWHRLRVRIQGDLMEAYLDDKLSASLRSPGIAHPTKTKLGMTVDDATIDFDNLKIFKTKKQ